MDEERRLNNEKEKSLSGLLAGALILTSVVVPGMGKEVKAEEYDLTKGLVASFSFEDDLSGGNDRLADAITVPNNFSTQDYTGEITYDQGQTGKSNPPGRIWPAVEYKKSWKRLYSIYVGKTGRKYNGHAGASVPWIWK